MTAPTAAVCRPLALVTGGWRRIGAAIARRLAADGWDLALHAHQPRSFDSAFADALRAAGARVLPLSGNLGDPAVAAGLLPQAAHEAGCPVTLLVNCASAFEDDTIATVTPDSLDRHMRVNLHAPVLMTRALAEGLPADMEAGVPCVVHVLDQRVTNPVPDQLSYSLSKQALHASVRTLARALAPRVRVNAVAPGLTLPTPDYRQAQWERLTAMMPLARLATPDEIATAVTMLAGARAITGQTLFVDGGAHLESFARDFIHLAK